MFNRLFLKRLVLLARVVAVSLVGVSLLVGCSFDTEKEETIGEKKQAVIGATCATDADCGTCEVCDTATTLKCVAAPDTTSCDDGVACTANDECTGGVCGGTTVDPDDGNPCTNDACNGTSTPTHTNNTASCNDGNACTTGDVCGGGTCAGTDTTDDGNLCTTDVCNPATGVTHTNNTAACDDGNACTTGDVCGGGACAGTDTTDDGNVCTTDVCNPATGVTHTNNTGACDDGSLCTTGDVCGGGTCNGTAVTCNQTTNDCADQVGVCDPADGICKFAQRPNNTPCDDGNACTGASGPSDRCQSGVCTGGAATVCSQSANACRASTGICNTTTGVCSFSDLIAGTPCGTGPSATVCGSSQACNGTGTCTTSTPNSATPCNDGNACTGAVGAPQADHCNGTGLCVGGTTTTCATPPNNQCYPATGTCNVSGVCVYTPLGAGTNCNDPVPDGIGAGQDCTVGDKCNGSGTCVPGTKDPTSCPKTDCAVAICDSSLGCGLDASLAKDDICRDSQGACDRVELCDGVATGCPSDAKRGVGEVCQNAACSAAVQVNQGTCQGGDSCVFAANVNCAPYQCGALTCQTSCGSDADCLSTHYCLLPGGTCEPRVGIGNPCTSSNECDSSVPYCVDGRCCNAPCSGQCEACDVPGSLGTCSPVTGAPVSPRPACATDGTACAGACDGTNRSVCAFPGGSVECRPPACDTGTNSAVAASTCNSAGTCISPTATDCAPYVCGTDACRGDCTNSSQCGAGLQCSAGKCVPLLTDGKACTAANQCASGNCVDGVCCNSACGGQCEACNVTGSVGSCSPVTGAPVMPRAACSGTGDCAGACDGRTRTSCAYPDSATTCREAGCVDGKATLAATCDGHGRCPAEASVTCPEECDGSVCGNPECRTNADCDDGGICRAGVCGTKGGPGDACSLTSDCGSGFCVDGVCCDTACNGQCEACDVTGSAGTCSPTPSGELPHGARQSCASDGTACGGTCNGSERTACGYPTTECRAGSCADGGAVAAANCNGAGSCPAERVVDCGVLGCTSDGLACDGPCAADPTACAAGEFCAAGICVAQGDDGARCGADGECANGHCVDGVCCDAACDAQCAACDVPGSVGTCTAVTGPAHGARAGCGGQGLCGSQCDGDDEAACHFAGSTVTCAAASCSLGVVSAASTCDGDGSCAAGEQTSCPTLTCSGSECGAGCTSDEECPGDEVCEAGACKAVVVLNAEDKGSCGCRVVGGGYRSNDVLLLALGALGVVVMRRRKKVAA